MFAMIVLIVLMAVAVAVAELMRRSPAGKESVESPAEIAGD